MKIQSLLLIGCLVLTSGCVVKESVKKVVGNSTYDLEQARTDAISESFYCTYEECFQAITALGKYQPSNKPWEKPPEIDEGVFHIHMTDLYANPPYIVIYGIPGNVDTTEAGIFFERISRETIRVDVSSLSTTAKRTASNIIFNELKRNFKAVE